MTKAVRYLIYSQLSLLGFVLICYLILPEVSSSEGGISNYGVHWSTVFFYTLGFALNIWFLVLAVRQLPPKSQLNLLKHLMYLTAFALALVWFSTYPYKINNAFGNFHKATAQLLFAYEFLFGIWLMVKTRKDWLSYIFFAIQLSGSVIALLTVYGNLHLLFVGQLLGVSGFGALLARSTAILTKKSR